MVGSFFKVDNFDHLMISFDSSYEEVWKAYVLKLNLDLLRTLGT